jgi:hypothetical protein
LLDNAGYEINSSTGWRFNLSIIVGDWDVTRVDVADMIKSGLMDVGINASLRVVTWEEWLYWPIPDYMDAWEACFGSYANPIDPGVIEYRRLHSQAEGPGDGKNWFGFTNATADMLLERGLNTTEYSTRKAFYDAYQEIIAQELPLIPVYYFTPLYAYNNDFHNFTCMTGEYYTVLDSYSLEKVWYTPTLSGQGKSPIKVCFFDSAGRRSGYCNGSIVTEIPESEYLEDQELVKIRSPNGQYSVELYGTDNGTYDFEVVNIALSYKNMYLPAGTIRAGQVRRYSVTVHPDGTISTVDHAADIDGDNDCDIYDVVVMVSSYGSTPADPEWNMLADVAPPLDQVDIYDVVTFVAEYGQDW